MCYGERCTSVVKTISIQHAHVSFRRSLFERVRFPEELEYIISADSIFCGRVLTPGHSFGLYSESIDILHSILLGL
jgi:hypothetical protein